jgi:hypothetical protein
MIEQQKIVPDLILNGCPVNCKDCKRIYLNDQIRHRIVCKCPCHPLNEEKQREQENKLQSASLVASPKRQAVTTTNPQQHEGGGSCSNG